MIDFVPRSVCPRCRRPARVCYCAHVPRVDTSTRVVILQHPRERDVPIGTARMASLCLPRAELHVGTSVAECGSLARTLEDPARLAILLYPGPGAIDVAKHPPKAPVTLVVVDGTWSQAKKVVKHDATLARLPRYAFDPPEPSEYRIRREPAANCVSTIEALMHVLGALEGDAERFRALLAPFRAMVDTQIAHVERGGRARVKKARAARRAAPRVPTIIRERARDLVCVVGEANAWPYTSPERDRWEQEIVHWVACRVQTGETFECVVRPTNPLAPGTLRWVELEGDTLERGATLGELEARWSAFARADDVVATWGNFAANIFSAAGLPLARARVDVREAARSWARGKVGTLDDFLRAAGHAACDPFARGRAGRRLGQLTAITRFLTETGA
jgi:DTW domain-containing protein YfiP